MRVDRLKIARSLQLETLAEGIEDPRVADRLKAAGLQRRAA